MEKKRFQLPEISKEWLILGLLFATVIVCSISATACSTIQTPIMMVLTWVTAKAVIQNAQK